jgi:hypothetical protein
MSSGRRPPFTLEEREKFYDEIIDHIENVGTLNSWCKRPGNPSFGSVSQWRHDDESFDARYRRAREVQGHRIADDIIDIGMNETDIARANLLISAYKWAAPKFNVEYSEKTTTDITSSDGALGGNSTEKLEQKLMRILERAHRRKIHAPTIDVTPARDDGLDLV